MLRRVKHTWPRRTLGHVWMAPPRGIIRRALAAFADPHIVAEVGAAAACASPRHLLHGSQSFDETAIAQAYNADAGVVQVDRHPQSDRKNDPVNGVEQRKPATHTTIA